MPTRWRKDEEGIDSVWMDPDDSELFKITFDYFSPGNIGSYEVDQDGIEVFGDAFEERSIVFYVRNPQTPYGEATFQATSSADPNISKSKTVRFYAKEM